MRVNSLTSMAARDGSVPLKSAVFPDGSRWLVGSCGVESLWAYAENGQMALVPWIRCVRSDGTELRCSAEGVILELEEKIEDGL